MNLGFYVGLFYSVNFLGVFYHYVFISDNITERPKKTIPLWCLRFITIQYCIFLILPIISFVMGGF